MPRLEFPLQVPSIEEGFCNNLTGENWVQVLLNKFGQSVAIWDSGSGAGTIVLNQESPPSPEQRDFLWRKPSTGLTYQWDSGGGAWTVPHPLAANGIDRRIVEGTPAEIWAYDGGDGSDPSVTPPAANVGAMWVVDTNFDGRSPMGVGAIPTSNPAKNLSLSEDFGEGAHRQIETEMFRHSHPPKDGYGSFAGFVDAGEPSTFEATSGTEIEKMTSTGPSGGHEDSDNDAANVVHPVRGVYFIKRSARTNYVG